MYAQPDQYAWFAVLSTAGPAILVGALGAFFLLLLNVSVPTFYWLAVSLAVAGAGLALGIAQVRPAFHARKAIERVIRGILALAALISIAATFGILFSIISEALRFFQLHSLWAFLTGTTWSPGASFLASAGRGDGGGAEFGSVPLFAGTFMITLIAMLVAVPIGLLSAIYMSEYAPGRVRTFAKPMLEVLAGIPTVVYGFFCRDYGGSRYRGHGRLGGAGRLLQQRRRAGGSHGHHDYSVYFFAFRRCDQCGSRQHASGGAGAGYDAW